MRNFICSMPTKILFGKGQIDNIGEEIKKYGTKVLLVYGKESIKKIGLYDKIIEILNKNNIFYKELSGIDPNPRLTSVKEGIDIIRKEKIDFILAAGGGSVIDCAKAIACGVEYDKDVWDFFIDKAQSKKALPIGTVLTLAATGSEMNGNSVISNMDTMEKKAVGNEILKPKFSVLDPEYTCSVSQYHTAAGIADIMSHIFEQYFSPTIDTYVQDRMAESLLKTCIHYAPLAIKNPNDYMIRANIMWTGTLALNGMIGYGKIGDWACHAIEHEISAKYDVTHGMGLGVITTNWMQYILNENTLDKFYNYAVNVWGINETDKLKAAKEGIKKTREFYSSIGIPITLKKFNIKENSLYEMAEKTVINGNVGNIMKLDKNDVYEILKMSY